MNLNEQQFKVIVNPEAIFTILPIDGELPFGWDDAGKIGSKKECLEFINIAWQNSIPSFIRAKMEEIDDFA